MCVYNCVSTSGERVCDELRGVYEWAGPYVRVSLSVSHRASREGEFRESDDCSLLLFLWLAVTPQAASG